ncbi:MAG: hypothetical protein ACRDDZ_05970 [Marinifilaceae bacterium]
MLEKELKTIIPTPWREFYDKQSPERKKEIRQQFLEQKDISYPGWYGKMRRNNWDKWDKIILQNIVGDEVRLVFET